MKHNFVKQLHIYNDAYENLPEAVSDQLWAPLYYMAYTLYQVKSHMDKYKAETWLRKYQTKRRICHLNP